MVAASTLPELQVSSGNQAPNKAISIHCNLHNCFSGTRLLIHDKMRISLGYGRTKSRVQDVSSKPGTGRDRRIPEVNLLASLD